MKLRGSCGDSVRFSYSAVGPVNNICISKRFSQHIGVPYFFVAVLLVPLEFTENPKKGET